MNMHKVTIGMPVYNDVLFLKMALDSILSQSFKDFILLISDDCSTDDSGKICLEYQKKDKRIKYIRQKKNIGVSKNMKYLLNQAKTKYFIWAGDDDIMSPFFLESLINAFHKNPNIITAFTPVVYINEENKQISEILKIDYSGNKPKERLTKLINAFDDSCGYGMFKREKIVNVKFPVWIWPNKRNAYNNIYPTICHYLAVGEYKLVDDNSLLYIRVKTQKNINHETLYEDFLIRGWFVLIIRKLNLILFSFWMIIKANQIATAINIFPKLLFFWFWKPIISETKHRIKYCNKYKIL